MVSAIMLNVTHKPFVLNVVMLSVVAPLQLSGKARKNLQDPGFSPTALVTLKNKL